MCTTIKNISKSNTQSEVGQSHNGHLHTRQSQNSGAAQVQEGGNLRTVWEQEHSPSPKLKAGKLLQKSLMGGYVEDAGVYHLQVMSATMGSVTPGGAPTHLLALSFSRFSLSESLTYLDDATHILGEPFPLAYCPICQSALKIPSKNTPRVLYEYLRQFSI